MREFRRFFLCTFSGNNFFLSIGSIFCSFKIRIHNSCTYKFSKRRSCKNYIHTIGGVDSHLPNRKVTYRKSSIKPPPRGAYLFQAHLKGRGGGCLIETGCLFFSEKTMVSVLQKELEYEMEKLKYKKL